MRNLQSVTAAQGKRRMPARPRPHADVCFGPGLNLMASLSQMRTVRVCNTAKSKRLEAALFPCVLRIRSGQRAQIGGCSLRRSTTGMDGAGEGDVALQLARQRPDQGDALHREDFADVEQSQLGIA